MGPPGAQAPLAQQLEEWGHGASWGEGSRARPVFWSITRFPPLRSSSSPFPQPCQSPGTMYRKEGTQARFSIR